MGGMLDPLICCAEHAVSKQYQPSRLPLKSLSAMAGRQGLLFWAYYFEKARVTNAYFCSSGCQKDAAPAVESPWV